MKYKSITEVSRLLNIKTHVIRYWDSKFDGISTRLSSKKQRFFNSENIKKLKELKEILYQNGKHNYSLDLANKIVSKKIIKNSVNPNKIAASNFPLSSNIESLKQIRQNLRDLLKS